MCSDFFCSIITILVFKDCNEGEGRGVLLSLSQSHLTLSWLVSISTHLTVVMDHRRG